MTMEYLSKTVGNAYLNAISDALSGGRIDFWAFYPARNEDIFIASCKFSDPAFNNPFGDADERQMEAYPISTGLIETQYPVPFPDSDEGDLGSDERFEPRHARFHDRNGLYLFKADFRLYNLHPEGYITGRGGGDTIGGGVVFYNPSNIPKYRIYPRYPPEEFWISTPIDEHLEGLHNSEVIVIRSMNVSIA